MRSWRGTACLAGAAIAALLLAASPAHADWQTRVVGVVDISFQSCMDRSQQVLQQQGYRLVVHPSAVGGYLGDYSAQIICAPRQVVVAVEVGPDSATITSYLDKIAQGFLNYGRSAAAANGASTAAAAPSVNAGAICPGDRVPLDTSLGGSPFVRMQLAGHEGMFMIDTGAEYSSVDAALFGAAPQSTVKLTGSSLPTIDGGAFRAQDMSGLAAPGGRMAGVIGTDFLSGRIAEFHLNVAQPFMVLSAQPCPEQNLRNHGLIPVPQGARFTADPKRRSPGIPTIPTLYLHIGAVLAPAWIDTGYRDSSGARRIPILINEPFRQALRDHGVATQPANSSRSITDCLGQKTIVTDLQVSGTPLSLGTADGQPVVPHGPPLLAVKPASKCGGIESDSAPFAVIGSLDTARLGVLVLDGRNSQIWIGKPHTDSTSAALYNAMALAWNDLGGSNLAIADTVENAETQALAACNQNNGNCRTASSVNPLGLGCIALAANIQDPAKMNAAKGPSFSEAQSAAVDTCTKNRGSACQLAFLQCND